MVPLLRNLPFVQHLVCPLAGALVLLSLAFVVLHQFAHGPFGWLGMAGAFGLVGIAGILIHRLVQDERQRGAEAEARLNALEEQVVAVQRTESVSILAAGIAHDFNNVLASIIPNVELARAVLPGESLAHPMLDEIAGASERGAQLSQRLLGYTRRKPMPPGEVQVTDVIERVRPLFASASRTATVQYNLDQSLPPLWGDSTQLAQVVMNLVLNSIEAIGPDHGTIAVESGVARAGTVASGFSVVDGDVDPHAEVVYLRVSDNGPGVPPGVAGRVFEPFFSTKTTGTGLGLAATAGIVRSHGGAIGLAPGANGAGASFTVLLPCAGSPAREGRCGAADDVACRWRSDTGACGRDGQPAEKDEIAELLARLTRRQPGGAPAGRDVR